MSGFFEIPLQNDFSRKIIHIDMDAFYASVEERDNPDLRGKPLVIAKHPKDTGGKGVVTTANYEARKFGIHSAMSAKEAYELCPTANFIPGRMYYYKEISAEIRKIFKRYTDMIEPLSLDEAYLDVTNNKIKSTSAIKIASMIQQDIWRELHLTCSAGISYNKFLAKLASDFDKPAGQTVILPEDAVDFLKKLPIEDFYGVGKRTVPKMHQLGIFTGEDLYQWSEMDLIYHFGKMGYSLYRKVRGVHLSPVNPNRERKSIGREQTYREPVRDEAMVIFHLRELARDVAKSLQKNQKHGQTVVLKVRTTDYETKTKRKTFDEFLDTEEDIYFHAFDIWQSMMNGKEVFQVRLLGITVTNLAPKTFHNIVLPL